MVVLGTLCGIGAVAVALAIGDLLRRNSRRRSVRDDRIDAARANSLTHAAGWSAGEYLPPAGGERPPH